MKVLTEGTLRTEFKNKIPDRYFVDKKVLITFSARQYLKEKKVELVVEETDGDPEKIKMDECHKETETGDKKTFPKYVSCYFGGVFEEKPEHMTQIYGNMLVNKDHPRIVFRGKLDSFQSKILELQVLVCSRGVKKLVAELEEILHYSREILRAEVLNEDLKDKDLIGLSQGQLREISHHPQKYFGVDHILPSYEMGEILVGLNAIRSSAREVEISAVMAFRKEYDVERVDIIRALNRLSSGIYIMMYRYKTGLYK